MDLIGEAVAFRRGVDQRQQPVAQFQPHNVDLQRGRNRFFRDGDRLDGFLGEAGLLGGDGLVLAVDGPGNSSCSDGQQQERDLRDSRQQR